MNKHRNKDRRFSVVEMVLLGFAAPALMGGGFIHAWLKNSQVEVVKDIRKTERRITDQENLINRLECKILSKTGDDGVIMHDLELAGCELIFAPASSIKKIPPYASGKRLRQKLPATQSKIYPASNLALAQP